MKIGGLRWFMVGLVFLATVINYIDRQTVSVLKTAISRDLGLSNSDYAAIQNSFLVFYGISQMVSGRLFDVVGTRRGFVFSIVVWSLAALAHATARSASAFAMFRAALGFGEAGNWPGAAKVVGEWFPVRERAFGMGIFNTGAAVGGALSPPIIAWLATVYGWRATFVVTGALGFIWLALWLVFFRSPAQHPWITEGERAHILDGASAAPAGKAWSPSWGQLLRYRQTWAVIMGRFITDPIWWLYIFWLPSYLQEARGFSLQQVGLSAWLPFLAGGLGALSGGYASGALISRGWTVDRARKAVMIFGAMLTPAGILAMRANDPYAALAWMAVVLFGFQVWVNNLQTLPSDFFPGSAVGSVFGLGGLAAAVASVLFTWATGRIVDRYGYTPVFLIAGVLGPAGLVVTLALAGRIGTVVVEPKEQAA
ncbi:MAG: MFS transporter [Vicinamibacteria bacterium]|nr:MFS transporter [Vicinamibacteria bacterium]